MADRCVHDMDPATCSWCSGRDGGEAAARARDKALIDGRRAIPASFAGSCAGCGDGYGPGTPISKRNGDTGWRASCCLDEHGRPTR